MTANMPVLLNFFENFITFFGNWPTRTGLIFDIEISRTKVSELFVCCWFWYSIFTINTTNFFTSLRCVSAFIKVKHNEFSVYSDLFFNSNNFWYTIPISIKLNKNFKCHLSNARLVLLMRLVVTEIYLLLTPSVGKCNELFQLSNIVQRLNYRTSKNSSCNQVDKTATFWDSMEGIEYRLHSELIRVKTFALRRTLNSTNLGVKESIPRSWTLRCGLSEVVDFTDLESRENFVGCYFVTLTRKKYICEIYNFSSGKIYFTS